MALALGALPKPVLAPSSQQWFLNDSHCCYWSSCGLTPLPFPLLLFAQWFLLPAPLRHLLLPSSRTLPHNVLSLLHAARGFGMQWWSLTVGVETHPEAVALELWGVQMVSSSSGTPPRSTSEGTWNCAVQGV